MSSPPRIDVSKSGGSALALTPALNEAFWKLYGTLWNQGVLEDRVKEVARIRNARMVNCGL
jgi:hypothetical protein